MNRWKPVRTQDGSLSFAHPVHGQTCHSDSGAWLESLERYARATRIRETALRTGRVRLLDVGTGLGWNLAAAVHELPHGAGMQVLCLESDRTVLEAALALHASEGLANTEPARGAYERVAVLLRELLEHGSARAGNIEARILFADARKSLQACPEHDFDAVFLDPFSPGVDGDLWVPEFLAEIASRMAPQGILSTYTVSMGVRAGLLAAGLRIGAGPCVGRKASGTLASKESALEPLPEALLRKLERRAARTVKNSKGRDQGS